jgi:putative oxidoreductase
MEVVVADARVLRTGTGLLILRVILGILFFAHGYQKLITMGIPQIHAAFTKFNIPLPGLVAPLVTVLEFFGGIALVVGFLTRVIALLFAIEMACAVLLVHIKVGLIGPGGAELPLIFGTAAVALVLGGGGILSIDQWISRRAVRVRVRRP